MTEPTQPQWPDEPGPYVALIDASSSVETALINAWIDRCCTTRTDPVDRLRLPSSRRRRPFGNVDPVIGERLSGEDDPLCIPMRIAWLAPERDGRRRIRLIDVLKPGDPRDPNAITQRIILKRHADQCRVVIGQPARRSDLEKRWSQPTGRGPADGTTLGEFVALQAWLSLERAERSIRGQRYKVPKFLREDLFWSRPFQAGVERLARESGRPVKRVRLRTSRYLKEIAAQHSPYVIDVVNGITSTLIATAHQSVAYSSQELHEIYKLAEDYPLVFLPSHKSNFDHLVFQHVLYENELPLNHTAGGINLNFFLVGPLLRRSGIFFIRREFKNNEPYKFVLRQYLDYLLEKRFALEWYIEGGRSRSGKLREPRLGLLRYVTDSYQRGIADDVILVPLSINYDQISDVSSYAAEQRGRSKDRESLMWALKFIAGLRRRNGSIHIRFGEPLYLSSRVGRDEDLTSEVGKLTLPKVAFEISTRINDVTPITPISLVTLALLSHEDRGFTVDETIDVLQPFADFVSERDLPTTCEQEITSPFQAEEALDALASSGVVQRTEGLTETIYSIGPDQHLAAAYYRNTIIHFFVNIGITEVALGTGLVRNESMQLEAIIDRAHALRDLLKFEFFFSPSETFADEIRSEIRRYEVGDLEDTHIAVDLEAMRPVKSPIVLRPFIEAYFVVAVTLVSFGDDAVEDAALRKASLAMGEQLLHHGVLSTSEAVSTTLFANGIKLADNRGLLTGSLDDREAFRRELEDILAVLSDISVLEMSTSTPLVSDPERSPTIPS